MGKTKNNSGEKADVAAPSPSKIPLPPQATSNSTLSDLLASLSARIDETESSLAVLLKSTMTLSEQADSLPLLDRAKFFVTITYAIDSLIFSFLRTKGANYKDHPIMQELERVRAYTRKMNSADQVPTERTFPIGNVAHGVGNLVVDREAAQRMILHGIPKSQIVPDPNAKSAATNTTQKRTSPESDRLEDGRLSKKKKTSKIPERVSATEKPISTGDKAAGKEKGKPDPQSEDEIGTPNHASEEANPKKEQGKEKIVKKRMEKLQGRESGETREPETKKKSKKGKKQKEKRGGKA